MQERHNSSALTLTLTHRYIHLHIYAGLNRSAHKCFYHFLFEIELKKCNFFHVVIALLLDGTWTLNRIRDEIRSHLAELDVLEHIYKEGIIHETPIDKRASLSPSGGQKVSHATKASLLLAVLYQTLLQCDTMGEFAGQMVSTTDFHCNTLHF